MKLSATTLPELADAAKHNAAVPSGAAPRQGASGRVQLALGLACFLASLAMWTVWLIRHDQRNAPSVAGDSHDYENIAYHLAHGAGFKTDYFNPEWRKPYDDHGLQKRLQANHLRYNFQRAPALPTCAALAYMLAGRQFFAIYWMNALFVSAGYGLIVALAARYAGLLGGLIAWSAVCLDYRADMYFYIPICMSEPFAFFASALVFWGLALLLERPSLVRAALAGATLGAAILVRYNFVLWIPLTTLLIAWTFRRTTPQEDSQPGIAARWRRPLLAAGVYALSAVAIVSPWAVRNCLMLQTFMPLGTMGQYNLVGTYCDASLANNGEWMSEPGKQLVLELRKETWFAELPDSGPQQREFARASQRRAIDWIQENWQQVPRLMLLRLRTHWERMFSVRGAAFVLLMVVACFVARYRIPVTVAAVILVSDTLGVMATHAVGDSRFLLPIFPVFYLMASLGAAALVQVVVTKLLPGARVTDGRGVPT